MLNMLFFGSSVFVCFRGIVAAGHHYVFLLIRYLPKYFFQRGVWISIRHMLLVIPAPSVLIYYAAFTVNFACICSIYKGVVLFVVYHTLLALVIGLCTIYQLLELLIWKLCTSHTMNGLIQLILSYVGA
jgi:hypothetical protein